ncbi:MAG TPA: TAT-variant-translocated molybdopterin oxidoreductase [Polyangiaceae bacterium]|nr:TAT-variant-translocated molybdopterin oxidoreductase [Polyangiaceae bacterium]
MTHDPSRPDVDAVPSNELADLDAAGDELREARGPRFWKSFEELAQKESYPAFLERQFPRQAAEYEVSGLSRRRLFELSAASMALAGLASCTRQPFERVVPYVKQPEEVVPGKPLFFATAVSMGGYARGVLAESHLGRPTKLEGNPQHPASLGATDAITQAALLDLYDPDRSQVITRLGSIHTWKDLTDELAGVLKAQKPLLGAGVRILTETVTSPTLARQIREFLTAYPKAKWHQWEPAGRDSARAGAMIAFRRYVETRYDFRKADVVVSLDADFLSEGPAAVRYAKDWSSRRHLRVREANLSRLYVIETTLTLAGAASDHRLAVTPARLSSVALAIAAECGVAGIAKPALDPKLDKFATAVARDLKRNAGRSVVVAGEYAAKELHALAHAINTALQNVGTTVIYTDPVEANPTDQLASLADLVNDLRGGQVDTLVIAGANPVFTAPSDLDFKAAIQKAALRIHLGLHADETAEYCQWHVPEAHFLEAWADLRAFDGTVSIVQPLIEPLYSESKSTLQLLSALLERPAESSHDIVKGHWQKERAGANFEAFWRRTLHDGVMAESALPVVNFALDAAAVEKAAATLAREKVGPELTLVLRPDPNIHDGRFANNGWLQELPKPFTKLTWDNAVLVSLARGRALGLTDEHVLGGGAVMTVSANGRNIDAPVWVLPGLSDDVIVVHLGYGRRRAGQVGNGAGFDAYPLRTSAKLWGAPVTLAPTPRRLPLVSTQATYHMEGRALVRAGTIADFKRDPEFAEKMGEAPKKSDRLYPGFEYKGYAWGMTVDLSSCIACNACVVACQAENNIPVVGKEEVGRGRAMHWLRIDRYWEGDEKELTATHHQPMMCQHCEQAPCEVVCPVGATVHSSEGLNDMVYNRCVGTKYCSNNCPYKVRRFNFFKYSDTETPVLKLMRNPDVTVRTRGVMEKCTYCVQRISAKRIEAEKEDRPIRDGEIVTACQQACPTDTIVFGNINDPGSQVAKLKAEPHDYGVLAELNTQPRTTYLAKIKNPNPELEES